MNKTAKTAIYVWLLASILTGCGDSSTAPSQLSVLQHWALSKAKVVQQIVSEKIGQKSSDTAQEALAGASDDAKEPLFGRIDAVTGNVIMTDKTGATDSARDGQLVYEGYTINTRDHSEVHIVTADGGLIALRSNTSFRVDEYRADGGTSDKIFMTLFRGAARSITGWIGKRNAANYRMTTPVATIGIRGTDHETVVINKTDLPTAQSNASDADGDTSENRGEAGTYDTVYEGSTVLKTPYGEADVLPAKFIFAPQDQAVAPIPLASAPEFFQTRTLLIEERIEQRKEFLKKHLDQLLEERLKQLKDAPENKLPKAEKTLLDKMKFWEGEDKPEQKAKPDSVRNDTEASDAADNKSLSEAVLEYNNKNYAAAFSAFSLLAEQGNGQAQYLLAVMYGDGQGVPQDLIKSLMWANISVINGSKNKLGEMVTQLLTAEQISRAQDMAQKCLDSNYKNCA